MHKNWVQRITLQTSLRIQVLTLVVFLMHIFRTNSSAHRGHQSECQPGEIADPERGSHLHSPGHRAFLQAKLPKSLLFRYDCTCPFRGWELLLVRTEKLAQGLGSTVLRDTLQEHSVKALWFVVPASSPPQAWFCSKTNFHDT